MEDEKVIVVLTCQELDIDSLCSSYGYSHFLEQNEMISIHMQHVQLNGLQKEILDLCKLDYPKIISNGESLEEYNIVLVNAQSIENLHPDISPENVIGMMGNHAPNYYESLCSNPIHFEAVVSFSTLITEKFINTKTKISSQIASLLLIGIVLTTQGLNEEHTNNRDYVALDFLEKHSSITRNQIIPLLNKL